MLLITGTEITKILNIPTLLFLHKMQMCQELLKMHEGFC